MTSSFYVYVYFDPRKPGDFTYGEYHFDFEPFYVGKGYGSRYYRHLQAGTMKQDTNTYKTKKILHIKDQTGKEPIIRKYKEGLTESEAFSLEMRMIKTIGKRGMGPLVNLTDGGEGPVGYKHTEETKRKMSELKLGNKNHNWGKPRTEETKKNMHKKHPKNAGYNSCRNKHFYTLSNQQNFWEYFTVNQRGHICNNFKEKNTDVITYLGVTISRTPKNIN